MAKAKNVGDPYWEAETAINNAYAELARKQNEAKAKAAGEKEAESKKTEKK